MGKYSEADIESMLQKIRDSVDKQTSDAPLPEKNNEKTANNTSPEELIQQIKANIDEDVTVTEDSNNDSDVYDISGYEIEEITDLTEISPDAEGDNHTTDLPLQQNNDEDEEESLLPDTLKKDMLSELSENVNNDLPYGEIEKTENSTDNELDDKFDEVTDCDEVTDVFSELSVSGCEPTLIKDSESELFFENGDADMSSENTDVVLDIPKKTTDDVESTDEALVADEGNLEAKIGESVCKSESAQDEGVVVVTPITSIFKNTNDEGATVTLGERLELDEADINLAISLGSQDSLEDSIEFVKIREAKSNFIDPTLRKNLSSYVFDYKSNEYRGENTDYIKSGYRKEKKQIAKRMILLAFILFLTLFFEEIKYTSFTIPYINYALNAPYVFEITVMVMLILSVLISYKKIILGIKGFISNAPNYYTGVGIVVLISGVYSLAVSLTFKNGEIYIFNSVAIFALFLGVIGEYLHISREILTFDLISSEKGKLSLEKYDRTIESVKKSSYLSRREFYVESTTLVGRYFERTAKLPEFCYTDYIYTIVSLMVSLLTAVGVMVYTKNIAYFMLAFNLSATLSIPILRETLIALPFYFVSKKLAKYESAIIGDSVIDEYVGDNTIYLDESEILGRYGVKVANLKSYNNFNVVDIHYYYLSLFSQISGPLKNAFGEDSQKIKTSSDTKLVNVYDGGIEALIDGTNKVFVGTYRFFSDHRIVAKLPEERKGLTNDLVTMFMSVNGALCAEFQLKYTIDRHFQSFAEEMAASGSQVGVRTIDPNVSEEMLQRIGGFEDYIIKVTRPTLNDLVPIGKRSNSGIVTCKNHHMIPKILAECLKIKRIKNTQAVIYVVCAFLGIASVFLMSFFGVLNLVMPIYVILYHLLFVLIIVIYTVRKLKK